MSIATNGIFVTSNVSRDLEQSAAVFNTVEKVVWEYVSNSLDAAKNGLPVVVSVKLQANKISITDNGRGMSRAELANFFQMHGENLGRKSGKTTRGRFGTGKSAAFGLARLLTIDTIQDRKRNVVSLSRQAIKDAVDGKPFAVQDIQADGATSNPDGTTVTVSDFASKKRFKVEKVKKYVERHLGRFKIRATVYINDILCEYKEPSYRKILSFYPPPRIAEHLGHVKLIVKIAGTPLSGDFQGINILSNGIWHETTNVGIEKGEHTKYIFGEVDVPILEEGDWDIPAFDNTRSLKLNDQNPVVSRLKGWISRELRQVHEELVQEEEARRRSKQTKQLLREARKIAKVLNEDFLDQEMKLEQARRATDSAGVMPVDVSPGDDGLLPGEGDIPTDAQQAGNEHGDGNGGSEASEGETPRPGPSLIEGDDKGKRTSQKEGGKRRRRGVFSLHYENATPAEARSRYDSESKTIWINLDHLQISSALKASKGNIDGRQFREISYEVAAVEYALALEHERAESEEVNDAEDALYNVRETINRISQRVAEVLND